VTTRRKKKGEKANSVIHFAPETRLLEKARKYIDDLELFLEDRDRAIPILLRVLQFGDQQLKSQITLLLGGFAGHDITGPLYRMLKDPTEDGDLRHEAAVQLSVTFPLVKDPWPLVDCLLEDLKSKDADLRSHAALALGWKGNHRAAAALIKRLYDPEEPVQQAAVSALSNLRDEQAYHLLLQRLAHGRREQKRTILFNLWRFHTRREEVAAVYRQFLTGEDEQLRFDALVLLGRVTDTRDQIALYRSCLKDRDPRLRELALRRFAQLERVDLIELKPAIESMLSDPDMQVKHAAMQVLGRLG